MSHIGSFASSYVNPMLAQSILDSKSGSWSVRILRTMSTVFLFIHAEDHMGTTKSWLIQIRAHTKNRELGITISTVPIHNQR
jgi:hypothetical protein